MASDLIRAYPAAAPVLAGPILKNYDMPDADEIASKLEAAGQPQALPDEVKNGIQQLQQQGQQLSQKLQQSQVQMQELANENNQLRRDQANKDRELQIKFYEAQTARIVAEKPTPLPKPAATA
jgi:TolA-binding protein